MHKLHFYKFSKRISTVFFLCFLMIFISGCGKARPDIVRISEKYRIPEEKQLIVYTSHKEEVYLPVIREFESRTGIRVEVKTGGTAELFEQVKTASQKGECDIMFGGGIESYEAQKDLFMPYEVTEKNKLDPAFVSLNNSWTPFTELPLVFVYNNKLVSDIVAPSTWTDFFKDRWKGQIAFADLHNSGTSYTILSTLVQITGKPLDSCILTFLDQLDGKVLDSSGQVIANVSNGTFLIGITLEETAKKAIADGYDISMVYPTDGTSAVPDGCAMVKNAPHSYNAGLFIDFIVSMDTQEYAVSEFYRRTVRTDMALPEGFSDVKRADFDIARSANHEQKIFDLWDSYFSKEDRP